MTCSASSRVCPSTRSSTGGTATGSIWSRSRAISCSPRAGSLLVGRTVQFSRLAVRADARRRGIATAMLEVADSEARAAGRAGSCSTPRPTLAHCTRTPGTGRAARCSARRASSTSRWRRSLPEVRIDPLTGQRSIVAGDRAGRPGGSCPRSRRLSSTGKATRSPRAMRTAPRPSCTPSGRAAAPRTRRGGPSGSCPTCTPRSAIVRATPARRQPGPVLVGSAAARHEVIVNAPDPVVSLAELSSDQVAAAMEVWRSGCARTATRRTSI